MGVRIQVDECKLVTNKQKFSGNNQSHGYTSSSSWM